MRDSLRVKVELIPSTITELTKPNIVHEIAPMQENISGATRKNAFNLKIDGLMAIRFFDAPLQEENHNMIWIFPEKFDSIAFMRPEIHVRGCHRASVLFERKLFGIRFVNEFV